MIGVSEVIGMEGDIDHDAGDRQVPATRLSPQGKVIGDFEPTGVQPMCLKRFEELGVHFDPVIFNSMPAGQPEVAWSR